MTTAIEREQKRHRREDREQTARERIERELATSDVTGFDVLVQNKHDNILKLIELVRTNPSITREEISKKLGISLRTTSRYLSVIRKVLNIYVPVSDVQIQQRDARIKKMKQILIKTPSISISDLASKLGVSSHTVYQYLKAAKKEG